MIEVRMKKLKATTKTQSDLRSLSLFVPEGVRETMGRNVTHHGRAELGIANVPS